MTIEELKQWDELSKVSRVIKELGFIPDISMCDDKPDICLPSKENRLIGIEVTEYLSDVKAIEDDALEKILVEYAQMIDSRTDKRYHIFVRFMLGERPTGVKFNTIKKDLLNEMDSFYFCQPTPQPLHYIENVSFEEIPGMDRSRADIEPSIFEYGDTEERLMMACVMKKERKLIEYKTLDKNQTIKEYHLVISASRLEHPEVRDYNLPKEFNTQYDRVYFVDDSMMKRLK